MLSLVCSGKSQGVDSQIGSFIQTAHRSGLWNEGETVHRSAITKSRKKLSWRLFEGLFQRAVRLAYEVFPTRSDYLWQDLSVFAIDGSRYTLPASEEIRQYFDPESGLSETNNGRGHYPLCLVSTAYDVFRRLPVARTVVSYKAGSERDEASQLIDQLPQGNVLLYDRGYPGYEFILTLNNQYNGYYVLRCPAESSFPAVSDFIRSGQNEATIEISATHSYREKYGNKAHRDAPRITLRATRLVSPEGTLSVLLSNLFDKTTFTRADIIQLYFRRWRVETHYRDEKTSLDITTFHSRSVNGVKQELFAVLIMAVIARTLAAVATAPVKGEKTVAEPQFKHAVITLSNDALAMVAEDPVQALRIFDDILNEIRRVLYHRPIIPKLSQPRVSKTPLNKWRNAKRKNIMRA